ncbi:MAG TPA: hypothetical protein VII66_00870 [Gemmatimonadaceae bacterium]
MTTQLDAFATSVPYARHSETSRDAAKRIEPHVTAHERDVLNAARAAGTRGITRKELAAEIGWAENQMNRITGRISELVKKGLVREDHTIEYDRLGDPTWHVVRRDGSAVLIACARYASEGRR